MSESRHCIASRNVQTSLGRLHKLDSQPEGKACICEHTRMARLAGRKHAPQGLQP